MSPAKSMQIAGILDVTYYIQKDLLFFRKFRSLMMRVLMIIMVIVMQGCQRTREPSFDLVAYLNGRRSQSFGMGWYFHDFIGIFQTVWKSLSGRIFINSCWWMHTSGHGYYRCFRKTHSEPWMGIIMMISVTNSSDGLIFVKRRWLS